MSRPSLFYRSGAGLIRPLLPVAATLDPKLRRGLEGRRESAVRFRSWAESARDPTRPLVLFHAPSVGEARQADAVMRRIREIHPDWQLAFTHFSPSAETVAPTLTADIAGYLPYDAPEEIAGLLEALHPSAIVFTKLDVWPELATGAGARGIPVGLIAGTVRPTSGRLRWPARDLLRPGYAALDLAGVISEGDGARLAALGTPADRIEVLGDPRYDSVMDLVEATGHEDPLLAPGRARWTIVAGSTWPDDEVLLLTAFAAFLDAVPEARLLLVPHESSATRVVRLGRAARRLGLPTPVPVTEAESRSSLLLEVRHGTLATLYGGGRAAHVGGGFGSGGLHSVLEPAAWGVPVTTGPRWRESQDAASLIAQGGARPVREPDELATLWRQWWGDEALRLTSGAAGRRVVESGRGAALRSAELVTRLVQRKS
jgi:3-deoxy-D-manno-octulosonic-acid transferase